MAVKATIFKCELVVSDLIRHYYQTHNLIVARHPSETDERMMLRILMFALYADELLEMTRGISTDDEPDLWQKSLSGEIEHWIELGQPDERRLRQACGRAKLVTLLTYGGNAPQVWWKQNQTKLDSIKNLSVWTISDEQSKALAQIAERAMRIQVMLDANQISLTAENHALELSLEQLK
jgi:uncharacterized protein YaeQ